MTASEMEHRQISEVVDNEKFHQWLEKFRIKGNNVDHNNMTALDLLKYRYLPH